MKTKEQMFHLVEEVSTNVAKTIQRAAMENDPEASDKVIGIYVMAACLQQALQSVASLVGWPKGQVEYKDHNRPSDCINSDSILFSAILLAKMSDVHRDASGRVYAKVSFGPDQFLAAINDTEKLLGRPLGDGMDPDLLEAARSHRNFSLDAEPSPFVSWPETIQ